jgi:hypothetical protein
MPLTLLLISKSQEMKKINLFLLAAISLFSSTSIYAQCNGIKGPNLLGAKGTFSAPFITVNNGAASCIQSGTSTYNPIGNAGNALAGCVSPGQSMPCSDYTYTAASGGLTPEARYAVLKVIGNTSGGNCIKTEWRGADHTGDGGYFMAVNGAPNNTTSPVFYKIKSIPVCIGTTYEFSAWVINLLPLGHAAANPGSEPNISFKVNGTVIGNSGPIAYSATPLWIKVGGSFVASTSVVDLEVVNATSVALGNDLGLDDISINVCQSQIAVNGPAFICDGSDATAGFIVTDATHTNKWYKWQKSTNGGVSFTDIGTAALANFTGNSYTLLYNLGTVNAAMNGNKYRLVVSTSAAGLTNPDCLFFNEYTSIVNACGPTPVSLLNFKGKYNIGYTKLEWQTLQEWDCDYFEILRSFNGNDFTVIGQVKGSGNSSTLQNYQYQDKVNGEGDVYYRLRQVDFDGTATLFSIVRISMGNNGASFNLYPNPFVTGLNASFSAPKTATARLQIRNMSGQVLYSNTIAVVKGINNVQLDNLPVLGRGLFQVCVQNEEINYQGKVQKL